MIHILITILIVLIIMGLLIYIVKLLPIPDPSYLKTLLIILVVIATIVYLLNVMGYKLN